MNSYYLALRYCHIVLKIVLCQYLSCNNFISLLHSINLEEAHAPLFNLFYIVVVPLLQIQAVIFIATLRIYNQRAVSMLI